MRTNITKSRFALKGRGSGRTLYLDLKPVAYLSQAGWRTSRRWRVYAPDQQGLKLGTYLFSSHTLDAAVQTLVSQTVPTHETWHRWADPSPIPLDQQARIAAYYASL